MAGIDFIHQNGIDYEIVPEIAPLFKTTQSYTAGQHVIYEAGLYTFKEDKSAGAWDATKVYGPFEVAKQISDLKEDLKQKTGLSEEAKVALLDCFEHVAWINEHGQTYYNNLYDALYPESALVRLEAVFAQGSAVVYPTTPLDDLKAYLTVTGYYNDGTSGRITGYALSGTLTAGVSTITAMKDGKTATFNVNVTEHQIIQVYVGKGVDFNSTAQILNQANRCISEKIPFNNVAPIIVQWAENTSYRWALKNEHPNGKIDPASASWYDDQLGEQVEQDPSLSGWMYSANENYKGIEDHDLDQVVPVAWEESTGFGRIVFAPFTNMSDPLPSELPSGYITITGTTYKIQCV